MPLGRYICDPIANSAQGEVPAEALDLVAWYATEDPDPEEDYWRTQVSPEKTNRFDKKILTNGINTNRGRGRASDGKIDRERPQQNNVLSACIGEDGPRPFNCCQVMRCSIVVGRLAS